MSKICGKLPFEGFGCRVLLEAFVIPNPHQIEREVRRIKRSDLKEEQAAQQEKRSPSP